MSKEKDTLHIFDFFKKENKPLQLGENRRKLENLIIAINKGRANINVYFELGFTYLTFSEYDKAIQVFSKILKVKANLEPQFIAKIYFYRGQTFAAKGEVEQTIADFNEAIMLDKLLERAHLELGKFYHKNKKYELALIFFEEAIKQEQIKAEALNARGLVYTEREEHNQAILDFTNAINLKPAFAEAYNNRGYSYKAIDDIELALNDFMMAYELDNSDTYSGSLSGLGWTCKSRKKYDSAIKIYNTMLEHNISVGYSYDSRGSAYEGMYEYKLAAIDFKKAAIIASSRYSGKWLVKVLSRLDPIPAELLDLRNLLLCETDFVSLDIRKLKLSGSILIGANLNLWFWESYPENTICTIEQLTVVLEKLFATGIANSILRPKYLRHAIDYCNSHPERLLLNDEEINQTLPRFRGLMDKHYPYLSKGVLESTKVVKEINKCFESNISSILSDQNIGLPTVLIQLTTTYLDGPSDYFERQLWHAHLYTKFAEIGATEYEKRLINATIYYQEERWQEREQPNFGNLTI